MSHIRMFSKVIIFLSLDMIEEIQPGTLALQSDAAASWPCKCLVLLTARPRATQEHTQMHKEDCMAA